MTNSTSVPPQEGGIAEVDDILNQLEPHAPNWIKTVRAELSRLSALVKAQKEALEKAEEWLSGWASAEPYLTEIRRARALSDTE